MHTESTSGTISASRPEVLLHANPDKSCEEHVSDCEPACVRVLALFWVQISTRGICIQCTPAGHTMKCVRSSDALLWSVGLSKANAMKWENHSTHSTCLLHECTCTSFSVQCWKAMPHSTHVEQNLTKIKQQLKYQNRHTHAHTLTRAHTHTPQIACPGVQTAPQGIVNLS